jgi:hypothetical protein
MSRTNGTRQTPPVVASYTGRIATPSPDRTPLLPLEIPVALLAALTIVFSFPTLNLPVWAVYIAWAGTLLFGKGTKKSFTHLYPALILGTSWGALCFLLVSSITLFLKADAWLTLLITMVVVAVAAITLLLLRHVPLFTVTPAAFLGFASFDAAQAGAFGPFPHALFSVWLSVTLMLLLGPLLVCATEWLTFPRRARETSRDRCTWTPTPLSTAVAPERPRHPLMLQGQYAPQRRPPLRPVRLLSMASIALKHN